MFDWIGDAAQALAFAALWRQVLLLAKIPQPMADRMKAAKSTEPYHDPAKARVVARNITFPPFMGARGLVPWRGVGQRPTSSWHKVHGGWRWQSTAKQQLARGRPGARGRPSGDGRGGG